MPEGMEQITRLTKVVHDFGHAFVQAKRHISPVASDFAELIKVSHGFTPGSQAESAVSKFDSLSTSLKNAVKINEGRLSVSKDNIEALSKEASACAELKAEITKLAKEQLNFELGTIKDGEELTETAKKAALFKVEIEGLVNQLSRQEAAARSALVLNEAITKQEKTFKKAADAIGKLIPSTTGLGSVASSITKIMGDDFSKAISASSNKFKELNDKFSSGSISEAEFNTGLKECVGSLKFSIKSVFGLSAALAILSMATQAAIKGQEEFTKAQYLSIRSVAGGVPGMTIYSQQLQAVGLTSEEASKTIMACAEAGLKFSSNFREAVIMTGAFSKATGISERAAAGFYRQMEIIGGEKASKRMMDSMTKTTIAYGLSAKEAESIVADLSNNMYLLSSLMTPEGAQKYAESMMGIAGNFKSMGGDADALSKSLMSLSTDFIGNIDKTAMLAQAAGVTGASLKDLAFNKAGALDKAMDSLGRKLAGMSDEARQAELIKWQTMGLDKSQIEYASRYSNEIKNIRDAYSKATGEVMSMADAEKQAAAARKTKQDAADREKATMDAAAAATTSLWTELKKAGAVLIGLIVPPLSVVLGLVTFIFTSMNYVLTPVRAVFGYISGWLGSLKGVCDKVAWLYPLLTAVKITVGLIATAIAVYLLWGIGAAVAGFIGMAGAVLLALWPLALVVLGIMAIVIVIKLVIKYWGAISGAIKAALDWVWNFIKTWKNILIPAVALLVGMLFPVLLPLIAIVAAVWLIVKVVQLVVKHWGAITGAIKSAVMWVINLGKKIMDWPLMKVLMMLNPITAGFMAIKAVIAGIRKIWPFGKKEKVEVKGPDQTKEAEERKIRTLTALGFKPEAIEKARAKEKKMAEGGVVTSPTRALVGESGSEAVIPLKKFSMFMPRIIVIQQRPSVMGGFGSLAMLSPLMMIPNVLSMIGRTVRRSSVDWVDASHLNRLAMLNVPSKMRDKFGDAMSPLIGSIKELNKSKDSDMKDTNEILLDIREALIRMASQGGLSTPGIQVGVDGGWS